MNIWPIEVSTWRDAKLAANSRHPLLAHLLETEDRVRSQFGDELSLEARNFAWVQLALYLAETDGEREKLLTMLDKFKQGVN